MKTFSISRSLSLPLATLTQRLAMLARTGAGKSYTAQKIAEGFLKLLQQIVVIDPNGAWWGLRTAADGKGKGYPILIMGGDHGDVPLEPTAGAVVADLVINEGVSVILDLSKFDTDADEVRFVTAFVDRLFRKNKQPLHLFVDEADTFAPQSPMKNENLMLNRMARLAKRGRSKGIGLSLISQRSAAISKRVLSQTEIMIAMQTTDPRDKKAIGEWMQGKGTKAKQEEILDSLPNLKIGEAWLWSPAFLRVMTRIQIAKKQTFDSSATPEVGSRTRKVKLVAEVDINQLKSQIASTIEKAKQEDPKLLKTEVAKLKMAILRLQGEKQEFEERVTYYEKEAANPKAPTADPAQIKALQDEVVRLKKKKVQIVEVPVLSPKELLRMENIAQSLKTQGGKIADQASNIRGHADRMQKDSADIDRKLRTNRALAETVKKVAAMPPQPISKSQQRRFASQAAPHKRVVSPPTNPDVKLRLGEKRILTVAVQHYPNPVSQARVGALAGYPYTGATYKTYFGVLKRHGLMGEDGEDCFSTELGTTILSEVEPLPTTTEAMLEMWNKRLRAGERRMLHSLVHFGGVHQQHPDGITEIELMGMASIEREATLLTYLGVLKRLQLITETAPGKWKAADTLFPQEV